MMKTTFVNRFDCLKVGRIQFISMISFIFIILFTSFSPHIVSAQCLHDKEEPTVVCRVLKTTFMPDTCMVVVWAEDLLTSATDDKTPQGDLIISFSPNSIQKSKTFFGIDGLTQDVTIYVTDKCGKQTACITQVVINDNENNCVQNIFDLALDKKLSPSTPGPFQLGSIVTFDIQVINQGSTDAYRIELTDYIPEGLILSDANWIQNGNLAVRANAIPFLAKGNSATVSITFTVSLDFTGTTIRNVAEISYADDDDNPDNDQPDDDDSIPDDDPNNDPEDEDDIDPEEIIIDNFDLALRKTILSEGPFKNGDEVTYAIEVFNQGTLTATNIVIKDFVSTYMTNIDVDWPNDEYTIASLAPLTGETVQLTLKINDNFQGTSVINNAEIIGADNIANFLDEDSGDLTVQKCVADAIGEGEVDNDIDDNPDNPADADECDHAVIEVEQNFDLALRKTVVSSGPFSAGDTVIYQIQVFNQGTIDAIGVIVKDNISANMTNVDPLWPNGQRNIGNLEAGESTTVNISIRINEGFQGNSIINNAEIIAGSNELNILDEDSGDLTVQKCVADVIGTGEVDDDINDNPDTAADADECDHAVITVRQNFDLALRKTVQSPGPFSPGDTVVYLIEVFNQGTLDATGVIIADNVSANMTNVDALWPNGQRNIGNIAAGESSSVTISLRINPGFQGASIINNAEVMGGDNALNILDEDSGNFADKKCVADVIGTGEMDNDINDNPDTVSDADECDHAVIEVEQNFDLAIRKRVFTSGPYEPGDTVLFSIEVFNQGTIDATDVVVRDNIPVNMTNVDPLWPTNERNVGNIAAGESTAVMIALRINAQFEGDAIINNAEIISASNSLNFEDEDSGPFSRIDCLRDSKGNEIDDELEDNPDNPDDNDECDFAEITVGGVFDLALRKTVAEGPYNAGDTVTYSIEVFNQGDVDATNVVIKDYVSASMTNVDSEWTNNQFTIDSLLAGQSTTITIDLRINEGFQGLSIINNAEIIAFTNPLNLPDEDSNIAEDCVADVIGNGEIDNDINDNPDTAADADECDHAVISVRQNFDLALRKTVQSAGPFDAGDTVIYLIEVFNQGTLDATEVIIADNVSTNMTNVDALWPNGTRNIGNIAAGQSRSVTISLRINSGFQGTSIINNAEIMGGANALNILDEDSGNFANKKCVADVIGNGEVDNDINDNPDTAADADECDHAVISVRQNFDLALRKTVQSAGPFDAGDTVVYLIEVFNQGTVNATEVIVADNVSANMTNVDALWPNGTRNIGNIAAGQSRSVTISLRINSGFQGTSIINNAEIMDGANALNILDEDSGNFANKKCVADVIGNGEVDNDINDNPDTAADADECDHAVISVRQNFDLALRKTVQSAGPFSPGDTVVYLVEVFNQGTLNATGVIVADNVSANMTNVDALWPNGTRNIGNIAAGQSQSVTIALRINLNFQDTSIINNAEIMGGANALNILDEDSGNFDNKKCVADVIGNGEVDNDINDNPDTAADADECDHAVIIVAQVPDVCVCPDEPYIGQAVVTCAGGAFSNEAVAAIVNLRNANTAPLGDNWAAPVTPGATKVAISKPATWVIGQLGQVFGTSLGRTNGDIFLGASNIYRYDGDPFTPSGLGAGGSQGIYKANFSNPTAIGSIVQTTNTFVANPVGTAVVPGRNLVINGDNPLPIGWGNLAYDEKSNMVYGTNLSDGRIYAINGSTGIIQQVFDPFGQAAGFLANPYPAGEVLWAIELNECTRQLFFVRQTVAGGGNVLGADGGIRNKEVYTLNINDAGVIDAGSLTLILTVNQGTREKITDIDFNTSCDRMILAERGTVHNSLTLLYEYNGTNWVLRTDISVGNIAGGNPWKFGLNSTGGVAFGADQVGGAAGSACDTLIWTMGDCLDPSLVNGECNVYGPQGTYIPEGNLPALSGNLNGSAIFIDITPEFNLDPRFSKFGLGDIEIFNCCCPKASTATSQFMAEVRGSVKTAYKADIPDVKVEIGSSKISDFKMTDVQGTYAFGSLEMHDDYLIKPSKVDDPLAGVTTLDLLLIQNHILGLNSFDDPLKIVAADADDSGAINGADVLFLRRLLLGKIDNQPTTEAWKFLTSNTADFGDNSVFSDYYQYQDLNSDMMNSDFVGVKIGDVNYSYLSAQSRSSENVILNVKKGKINNSIDLYIDRSTDISGMQFSLLLPVGSTISNVSSDILDIDESNFRLEGNKLFFSFNGLSSIALSDNKSLLSIYTTNEISLNQIFEFGKSLKPEAYSSTYERIDLFLAVELSSEGYSLSANKPNPFSNGTDIEFMIPVDQEVKFQFFTIDGRLIMQRTNHFSAGQHHITVSKDDLNLSDGPVLYKMITDRYSSMRKMILIK